MTLFFFIRFYFKTCFYRSLLNIIKLNINQSIYIKYIDECNFIIAKIQNINLIPNPNHFNPHPYNVIPMNFVSWNLNFIF